MWRAIARRRIGESGKLVVDSGNSEASPPPPSPPPFPPFPSSSSLVLLLLLLLLLLVHLPFTIRSPWWASKGEGGRGG